MRFECNARGYLLPPFSEGEAKTMRGWNNKNNEAYSISHELAHIGTNLPFYGNFKDNSLLIHFDGGASIGNFSAFHFYDGKLHELECHWKLSYLSKIFNDNALSFKIVGAEPGEHCSVPGKLMGFAAMGLAKSSIVSWLKENDCFRDIWDDDDRFFKSASENFGWNGHSFNQTDSFIQNVAASLQHIFGSGFLDKITSIQKNTNSNYLYLSGGCSLNIITNTIIVESGMFEDVFIPPCCSDSGLSIGATAFYIWYKNKESINSHSPYLNSIGCDIPVDECFSESLVREVAELIYKGKIIGVANGYGEAGPRALGNRSILARPDSRELAKKVSMQCKEREWYRPVAPVMLEKNAKHFTGKKNIHHLSKFMLLDFKIIPSLIHEIEGVVHSNGTARIQTVFDKSENPFMYELLTVLDQEYDIKALINTSFNSQGEPMVHTKSDAIKAGQRMGLDGVVVASELSYLYKDL